ncbi:UNVERIFIED_CONTAM: Thylakoid lumenal protein, chloroplastic [Sesamum calycinum]|uniref:Thylakoid lumenal protein, chloroplastic n=1 Tax=Sesamum calycinum TaxID=2727403 RepID=A0AAW2JBP4_9LAMI
MAGPLLYHLSPAFSVSRPTLKSVTCYIGNSDDYKYDKRKCSCKNDLDTSLKPAIWSKNLVSLAIAVTLIAPLPSSAILLSVPNPFHSLQQLLHFRRPRICRLDWRMGFFRKEYKCYMHFHCRKIRPCPSINPGCVSSNPKSSNFAFPWMILGYSSNGAAIQQLQDALQKTQKNVKIQLVEDTPSGKYLQAEVDGGFGRDVLEFLVNGDVVSFRAMATKVTYVYPFTTALGDSKGQEERMKQILNELGWYAPSFDSMD